MTKLASFLAVVAVFLFGIGTTTIHAYSFFTGNTTTDGVSVGVFDDTYKGYYSSNTSGPAMDVWSGYLIGFAGNIGTGDGSDLLALANDYLSSLGNLSFPPISAADWYFGSTDSTTSSDFAVTITFGDTNQFGTWSTAPYELGFYGVKAGNQSAIYFEPDYVTSGFWSAAHLTVGKGQIPELSHLAAGAAEAAPVPEPATMLMLGSGLIGLAGLGRKKLLKK